MPGGGRLAGGGGPRCWGAEVGQRRSVRSRCLSKIPLPSLCVRRVCGSHFVLYWNWVKKLYFHLSALNMSRYRDENTESKVYVGDLPRDAEERDLERAFGHYGPLKSVWVARNPPGFAFLEFEDPRDAEDAVRALDGTSV